MTGSGVKATGFRAVFIIDVENRQQMNGFSGICHERDLLSLENFNLSNDVLDFSCVRVTEQELP